MHRHTISILPSTGDVIVCRHSDKLGAALFRMYTCKGQFVYLMRNGGHDVQMCRRLSTHGKPLVIADGETLVEVITRELEATERPAWVGLAATWARRIVVFAVTVVAIAAFTYGLAQLIWVAR